MSRLTQPRVRPDAVAEAAVWVARLHGPDRSSQMERDCLAWQARSAEHRLAFERCTEVWQAVPGVTLGDAYAANTQPSPAAGGKVQMRPAVSRRWALGLAVAGVVVVGALGFQRWQGVGAYRTGVGEQQLVVLDDGTRMALNTATRVRVDLAAARRTVRVEEGEALFEVAKDPRRPFVVRAAGSEVMALGTVFSVRLMPQGRAGTALAVTLIEGQVAVSAGADARGTVPQRRLVLQPGERARLGGAVDGGAATALQVDRPRIEQMLAWKRGEVVFDDLSLADAVAEMNRYSRTPIVLASGVATAALRVSGQFRTGDNTGFARAVAALHGLAVHESQDQLELIPRS